MKVKIMCLLLCLCLLSGCSNWGEGTRSDVNDGQLSEDQLFTMLFDIHNKISIQLDMSDVELAKMQADYDEYVGKGSKSPIYRMGDLHVTITTPDHNTYSYFVEEVGVRMKGNTSRTDFYNLEEGIYNQIHLKLDFQETFDDTDYYGSEAKQWEESARDERKDRTFATLEKMDLRWNRCDDGTYLKEYFAYETYRNYGVLAPHTNLCSFDWAGVHMGVYTINEPIDKIFLKKNLPKEAAGGDLYKIGWAGYENGSFTSLNSIGIEDEDACEFFAFDLKTNKKTSSHEALINLIKQLNDGDVSKEEFAQLVDVQQLILFGAVSYILGNPDDLRNNYNNCYVYFRSDNGKAILIPYDYDRCLGVTAHWNPTGDGVTSDNPFSLKLNADGSDQKNPLFLYSVAAGGYFVKEYIQALEQIKADDWFTLDRFASLYVQAEANYKLDAQPNKKFRNTEGLFLAFDLERTSDFSSNGNISIREYVEAKRETLEKYLQDADRYTKGEPGVKPQWYIRCDKSNWQNDDSYAMTVENGLVSIHLTVSNEIRLKVYHDSTGRWFGAECVAEDCTVAFTSDYHTNIVLQKGSYRITFDPVTEIITLEKE